MLTEQLSQGILRSRLGTFQPLLNPALGVRSVRYSMSLSHSQATDGLASMRLDLTVGIDAFIA